MKNDVIIGGGAAGLFAACMLARGGRRVTLLEKQDRVGRKLLSTGNGRCNLTNLHADAKYYHGDARFVRTVLNAFPPREAMRFFEALGVPCVSDEEGRVYPMSNQASAVLDALRLYAAEKGVRMETGCAVSEVKRSGEGFAVRMEDGRTLNASRVLIACGGPAAPKLGGCTDGHRLLKSLGHTVTDCVPAIVSLKTDPAIVRGLKGIRARCAVTLNGMRTESGELLFAETGLSGICAMQLGRDVNLALKRGDRCEVSIDFLPNGDRAVLDRLIVSLPDRSMEDLLSGIVPKRLGQVLVRAAGITPLSVKAGALTPKQRAALYAQLRGWRVRVTGTLSYDSAQVTCGGAELRGFDPMTMQSRRVRGLYAAGEVLDADGDCGGFNLQWAWATAAVAARAMLAENP